MSSRRELFYNLLAQTSPSPLALDIERASGCYLFTQQGNQILDFISGIAVSNVGHCNPEIVNAIHDQLERYMHVMVYGEFIQSPQTRLAEKLHSVLPSGLNNFYFVNSGSEATEGALKLAKRVTGRNKIISFKNAYHGSTQGSLSVCGNEDLKNSFRPLMPMVHIIPFNDEKELHSIDAETAAVIIEPIQGEAGVLLPGQNFLEAVRKKCDSTGALLIMDEIQTGFGRTGKLFAFEHYNINPDILLLGKAMGGGLPIGAFISSKELMTTLTHHPTLGHITTFGGNPVCCASALASLELILKEKLSDRAELLGKIIRDKLHHPLIQDIRGKGLFFAVEFESEEMNRKVIDACIEKGVLVDWFLFAPQCMRIAPPLVISEEQIHSACDTILNALDQCTT